MLQRVDAAMRATNDRFYPDTQVAARYAHRDAVREFLEQEAHHETSQSGAAAAINTSGVRNAVALEQSLSRIDELIAERQNREQAGRANVSARLVGEGVDPRTPAGALADKENVKTIDDFAARLLGVDRIDGLDGDIFARPYQVVGLSREEPNPEYVALERDRAAMQTRLEQLRGERRLLADAARCFVPVHERLIQDYALQTAFHAPLEALQLLKPASEVRALNERWRNLLGEALARIHADYQDATFESLRAASLGDEARATNLLPLYMERVANPVLNTYVEDLQGSTFEDMPLTREVLRQYFERFVTLVLRALLAEEASMGEEALAELRAQQLDSIARNFAPALDRTAGDLRTRIVDLVSDHPIDESVPAGVGTTLHDEASVVAAYLKQALFVHANGEYYAWLENWLADLLGRAPELRQSATLDTLRTAVQRMVEGRARLSKQNTELLGRVVPDYQPPTEQEMVRTYARLVVADIAADRAKALIAQDEDDALRSAFQQVLGGRTSDIDFELLLRPRIDRFEILEQERRLFERELRTTFIAPPSADAASAQYQANALATELAALAQRNEFVRDTLLFYAPLDPERTEPHAPGDSLQLRQDDDNDGAAVVVWTPYDLSYPLDLTKTQGQLPSLTQIVRNNANRFDAAEMHERAKRLRQALSFTHADRLVEREIMRLDFMLNYLARPTRAEPLEVARQVNSRAALLLEATIELRDELQLALRAPESMRADNIQRVDDALRRATFTVSWYFRPRYGGARNDEIVHQAERLIDTQQLAAGQRTARLARWPNVNSLELGGLYRAEFRDNGSGNVYQSLFTAHVRIVARCPRDGAEFEVGTEAFGDCQWSEVPRDLDTHQFAEEVLVRVTEGADAVDALRADRRERNRIIAQRIDSNLFRAPWGAETEADVKVALDRFNAGLLMPEFRYYKIVARIFKRLGGQIRNALRMPGMPAQLRNLAAQNDVQLVSLLIDASLTDSALRTAQTVLLYLASQLIWSDPQIGDRSFTLDGIGDFDFTALFGGGDATSTAQQVAALENAITRGAVRVPTTLFEPTRAFSNLDANVVMPLQSTAANNVESIPLATVLQALFMPAVWQNLAAHERRFAHELFDRFVAFCDTFRTHQYRKAMQVRAEYVGDARSIQLAGPMRVRDPALERQIDQRLARMLPETVERTARGWPRHALANVAPMARDRDFADTAMDNLLLDHQLLADFNSRVRELVVRGKATEHHSIQTKWRMPEDRIPVVAHTTNTDCEAGGAARCYANAGNRNMWVGEHSYRTTQPDLYEIDITADGATRARVVKRGSAPINAGYDFNGFHDLIVAEIERHNGARDNTALSATTRTRLLGESHERVRFLELVYNFLALVAPRSTIGQHYMSALEMMRAGTTAHGDTEAGFVLMKHLQNIAPSRATLI